MKKASRPRREQPNMDLSETAPQQVGQDEDFSLEDILNEFGGWSKQQPAESSPEVAAPTSPQPEAAEPLAAAPPQAPEDASETEAASPLAPEGKPAAEAAPSQPVVWTYQPKAAPQEPAPLPQAARRKAPPPRRPRPSPVRPLPPVSTYPSAETVYKHLSKAARGLLLRKRLAALWCLLAVAVTVLSGAQVEVMAFLHQGKTAPAILLGLLLLSAVTGYDVLLRGVYRCLKLSFSLESLLVVAAVVFTVHGFLTLETGADSYAAVLTIGLWFALWGDCLQNQTKRRSLKTVLSMPDSPSAAVMARGALNGTDCIFRTAGSADEFVAAMEAPDGAATALRVYSTAALVLAPVLAAVLHFLRDAAFLPCWAAILAGCIPAAAFVVYWRPMASLSAGLQKCGAVLCGWQGARSLRGRALVAVEDTDLFAAASVSMNGMKVFGDQNVSQLVGYTYAVISASGCGLEPVFRQVYDNQNGRACRIDNFKRYEGGGIGAEIQGEVVLVGSIGFMQLMGVKMPDGTNVRQAVYCAVNGRLAAVFAIHYNPSPAVRSGLQTVLRGKGLSLLLVTRDFILTPAVIRHKYKIPGDSMDYPDVQTRTRLSGDEKPAEGAPAALFTRDSFLALAEAIAGGRNLCGGVAVGVAVSLLGGVVGFGIAIMLSFLGSIAAATALNMTLFSLLWALPTLLLTAIAGKS